MRVSYVTPEPYVWGQQGVKVKYALIASTGYSTLYTNQFLPAPPSQWFLLNGVSAELTFGRRPLDEIGDAGNARTRHGVAPTYGWCDNGRQGDQS